MYRTKAAALAGLLMLALAGAGPAGAIEIFGFKFLEPDEPDAIELIDPLPYTVRLVFDGTESEESRLRAASTLLRDAARPAAGRAGLLSMANGDYARIVDALYVRGRFGPTVSITINGVETSRLPLDAKLGKAATVVISVVAGPRYRFGAVVVENPPPGLDLREAGFERGAVASSTVVQDVARQVVRLWREGSHALAEVSDTAIVADHAAKTLNVRLVARPGPKVAYGDVTLTGTEAVDRAFVRFMADLPKGAPYHPDDLSDAQRRLVRLDTFRTVDIQQAETLAPDGSLPITIDLTKRKPRRFGFGATLSSVDGLGIEGFWLHRNILGRAERLRFDGAVAGIGRSSDPSDYDYSASVSFLKPGVFTPETEMRLGFGISQEKTGTFSALTAETTAGLATNLSDTWQADTQLVLERTRVDDNFGRRRFSILSIDNSVTYEGRDVPLDATDGFYLDAHFTPFVIDGSTDVQYQATLEGRAYRALDADGKYVLAARAKIGTVEGIGAASAPPQFLFFTGGGGSVRGFEYQSKGATTGGTLTGGRSLVEMSGEVRVDIDETLGGVFFVDAGHVGANGFPDLNNTWHVGGGVGIRFNTGLGPLRIDVARSLKWRQGDPNFALYIGLGQAF